MSDFLVIRYTAMSFREKSAWIILVTLLVLTLAYLLHIFPQTLTPEPSSVRFHMLGASIIAFVVIVVIAHIAVAIWSPRDAKTPKDERERLIEQKSTSISAYVYAFLSLASISTIHAGANQFGLAYLVVLAFGIAEIVNYAVRVILYRRGR
jgi:heme/copper-type cytochrome/quinol oxidase subunit 2